MEPLRSTDIKDIEDRGDFYHFKFNLYNYETLYPFHGIMFNSNFTEIKHYVYVVKTLELKKPDIGFMEKCDFFIEAGLPFTDAYHLLIPKTNETVVHYINNEWYSFEIVIKGDNGLILTITDNRIKRRDKIKKIKDKICHH